MYRTRLLGGAFLEVDGDPPPRLQRKQLALLSLLSSTQDDPLSREKLCGYLWPDSDPERARHRLADSLYGLRQALGGGCVSTDGENVRLEPDAVEVDVWEFEAAAQAGELERAEALYRGPFLDGFYLDGAPAFEKWVDGERERLWRLYLRALEGLAEGSEDQGVWKEASRWWRRRAEEDRYDSRVAARLVEARARAGDTAGALREAEAHAELLSEELGIEPPAALAELTARLRANGLESAIEVPELRASQLTEGQPVEPGRDAPEERRQPLPWHGTALSNAGHREERSQRAGGLELLVITGLLLVAALLLPRFLGPEDARSTEGSTADAEAGSTPGAPPGPVADDPLAHPPGVPSVAVLPFENLSGEEEDRHFVDGLHDELLTQLGRIGSLLLKSRTSVLEYRDATANLRTIGEELRARYIVEGGTRRAGDQIRVNVRLHDVRTDEQLWVETYTRDRTVEDLLSIQRDIALQVASELGVEVLPERHGDFLAVDAPEDLAAYERYLVGLSHFRDIERATGDQDEAYERAIENLSAASEAAPDWAAPKAVLGAVYQWMASRSVGGPESRERNWERSRALLEEAVAIDSLYEPAWASLGMLLHVWEQDLAASEAAYSRTRAGPPGIVLRWLGRFEESIVRVKRDLSRDPRSRVQQGLLGSALVCAGLWRRAIEHFETRVEKLDPFVRASLAYAYFKAGDRRAGLAHVDTLHRSGMQPDLMALLYALADSASRARELLLEAAEADLQGGAWSAAAVALGQPDRALDALERAAERAPAFFGYVQCYEEVRSLESDPRYARLLERLGLPAR